MGELVDIADRQNYRATLRAEIGRSMGLVQQALSDREFLRQNPHISALDYAFRNFAARESNNADRREKTRMSLWNAVLTQARTRDIPARAAPEFWGGVDNAKSVRTLAMDAHLFPDRVVVQQITRDLRLSGEGVAPSQQITARLLAFDSTVREIALQEAKRTRYRDDPAFEGMSLLDEDNKPAPQVRKTAVAAAARPLSAEDNKRREEGRKALYFITEKMMDKAFRDQNPATASLFYAIMSYAEQRTQDPATRERYEGALWRFMLTRGGRGNLFHGIEKPITQKEADLMTSFLNNKERPSDASGLDGVLPVDSALRDLWESWVAQDAAASPSQEPLPVFAAPEEGGNVVLSSVNLPVDLVECVRDFPNLVALRVEDVQNHARDLRALSFVNNALVADGFLRKNPHIASLVQAVNGYVQEIVERAGDAAERKVKSTEVFNPLAVRKDIASRLWGALLSDAPVGAANGDFLFPDAKETALALSFFKTPGLFVKPNRDEFGNVLGHTIRSGENNPLVQLRALRAERYAAAQQANVGVGQDGVAVPEEGATAPDQRAKAGVLPFPSREKEETSAPKGSSFLNRAFHAAASVLLVVGIATGFVAGDAPRDVKKDADPSSLRAKAEDPRLAAPILSVK